MALPDDSDRTDPGMSKPRGTPALAVVPARPQGRMPEMGPLEAFMRDPFITEIMVNDTRNVMVEREGKVTFSGFAFQTIDELNRIVRNILDVTGRIISPDSPYVDVMLGDGSRVNIIAPPLTVLGPAITIRKFPTKRLSLQELLDRQSLDNRMAYFLSLCAQAKVNVLISGGTGSGKTTLLNALAHYIPKHERIVTIEDTPELVIGHINSVRLQTKPQSPGSAAIHARELVANSLRMRPDRILVGECRRAEAFDMLQAMNTGHTGSMTTIHANTTRDALSRLETLCLMADVGLPLLAIRKQITSAIDLVVQIQRFRDGKRRITAISELTGMESEVYSMLEIYRCDNPEAANGPAVYKPTGLVPTFVELLEASGLEVPRTLFS